VPYPDISTKAKAQKFIGLDMDKLHAEKKAFIERVVPEWHRQAEEREQLYNVGVLNVGVLND
jgi:nitrite reductase (cytochrome c-552)